MSLFLNIQQLRKTQFNVNETYLDPFELNLHQFFFFRKKHHYVTGVHHDRLLDYAGTAKCFLLVTSYGCTR